MKSFYKVILSAFCIISIGLLNTSSLHKQYVANAEDTCIPGSMGTCENKTTFEPINPPANEFVMEDLTSIFNSVSEILKSLGIILAIFFILNCGYKFMTSQGQPDKMKDAKECLTSAIIGMLVVTMAASIFQTLINLALGL